MKDILQNNKDWDLTRKCTCILGFYFVSFGEWTQAHLQKQLPFFPIRPTLKWTYIYIYTFWPIENIMQILSYQKKCLHLNTIERFYIHKENTKDNQLNDKQIIFPNKIFDAILIIGM